MSRYPYTIVSQDDGAFFVQFLDFPTGFTEGYTEEDAKFMAGDMLTGLVEAYKEEGIPLPKPSAVAGLNFVEI